MDAVTFQAEAMRLEKLMYHVSYSILRNNEDCADAVQEALTRAWQKRGSLRSMERFRPWLMRILVNQCNDMLRKVKKRSFFPLEEDTVAIEPPQSPVPLQEALDSLKPEWRVVISLHYLEGYSIQEMSDMLAIPTGTIKTRMRFGRERLSILLREEWEEA
ncbi:MAG: RNA polymerase sigma factor [Clostridia bacterium]